MYRTVTASIRRDDNAKYRGIVQKMVERFQGRPDGLPDGRIGLWRQ